MSNQSEGPEYMPGARVLMGEDEQPGTVRRTFHDGDGWRYYVAMDGGMGVTCTGKILKTGYLEPAGGPE